MNRAYSLLTVKSVEDDKRIITGVATTPEPDRMLDVVEPLGVKFKNPLPLLWQHRSDHPVGTVKFDKPTKDGITFEARLPKIDEPGPLQDRVNTAWGEIKAGLVRAVSIGFRSIEHSVMDNGGWRFVSSEVLELSLVTIPANQSARIETIKSIDAELLAATGHEQNRSERTVSAGASATRLTPVVKALEGKQVMAKKTIAEQIAAFTETRRVKADRMDLIMDAAADKGETLDAAQKEEYDTLEADVKSVDEHLGRLRVHEERNKSVATAVDGKDGRTSSESRGNGAAHVISVRSNVPKGIGYTRLVMARAAAQQFSMSAIDVAQARGWFNDTPELELALKTAVAVGTTTDTTWASPLVVAPNLAAEFIDLLRPETIIGRIPGLRRVPFNIKVPRETTAASVNWVGEGKVKPVSAMAFDSITMGFTKVAGIVPVTEELIRFSSPAVETLVRDSLISAVAQLTDRDFLDPTKAEAVGVSPASITNGVTPVTATGATADAFRDDLGTMLSAYAAANMNMQGLVLIMTSQQALRLSLMRNTLGGREFDGLGPNGGTLEGIPVLVSENMVATGGSPTDGGLIVAVNAPEVMLADDGNVDIALSREASIQMETTPDSPATASTITVSAFQYNMVFIRAERFINWKKRRDTAVQFIQYAKYQ